MSKFIFINRFLRRFILPWSSNSPSHGSPTAGQDHMLVSPMIRLSAVIPPLCERIMATKRHLQIQEETTRATRQRGRQITSLLFVADMDHFVYKHRLRRRAYSYENSCKLSRAFNEASLDEAASWQKFRQIIWKEKHQRNTSSTGPIDISISLSLPAPVDAAMMPQ